MVPWNIERFLDTHPKKNSPVVCSSIGLFQRLSAEPVLGDQTLLPAASGMIGTSTCGTPSASLRAAPTASAARSCATPIDCFVLLNQPTQWNGAANPFAALGATPSPSFAYGATIGPDAEAFLKRIDSAATRKKLRAKERKLAEIGPLTYERALDVERARTILEAFVDQKTLRFRQKNRDPGFAHVAVRAFLDAMSGGRCGGAVALDFYALSVGDRIVATYGGMPRGRAWHGLVNSFNVDPQVARSSPAELLLRHIVRDLGRRGIERFDLGSSAGKRTQTHGPQAPTVKKIRTRMIRTLIVRRRCIPIRKRENPVIFVNSV